MAASLCLQHLDDRDFARLRKAVYGYCGIRLTERKRRMVEGRLRKRVRALGLAGFADYCRLVFDSPQGGDEFVNLIDVITTNKTDFFREPEHFSFLSEHCAPPLADRAGAAVIWSAACSTGEEPWSLAMTMEACRERFVNLDYTVYASDICTRVLRVAARAVYEAEKAGCLPEAMKRKFLLRSRDRGRRLVRVRPFLRRRVRFFRCNLKKGPLPFNAGADIIFCRNVLIYFDAGTQELILRRLVSCLRPGGRLFLGHSESVHGMRLPLAQVRPTVYEKRPGA